MNARTHNSNPTGQEQTISMEQICQEISLVGTLNPDLYDRIAQKAAQVVASNKKKNKNTQLRKFYNELIHWEQIVASGGSIENPRDKLQQNLPLIRMMNAKAAYAEGRNLVGREFVMLLRKCLMQIEDDPETLKNCCRFFEAFMGFYKLERPNQ